MGNPDIHVSTAYLIRPEMPPEFGVLSDKSLEFGVSRLAQVHFPAWSGVFLQTLFLKIWAQYLAARTK